MTENLAGARSRQLAFFHDGPPIDQNEIESFGKLMRLLKSGFVLHARRIEQHQVRPVTLAHQAAIAKPESTGRQRSHLSDGILERQDIAVAHILGERPRVRPIRARMWNTGAEFADAAVAGEAGIRILHDPVYVFIAHGVIYHLNIALRLQIQNGLDLVSQLLLAALEKV